MKLKEKEEDVKILKGDYTSGQIIPPYVIFDIAPLNVGWTEGEVPVTT